MVFAVWAVRRDFAEAYPGVVKEVHQAFLTSRELCLTELDTVASAAARWEPFSADELADYFRALDFALGERQIAGLREFAARAAEAGSRTAARPRRASVHRYMMRFGSGSFTGPSTCFATEAQRFAP